MAGTPITVAHGDGIGPEIMDATLHILKEAGARLDIETIEVGEKVYLARQQRRHRAERVGIAAPHEGLPEGADHDAAGRRLQEPQRHDAQDARPLRQRPARASPITPSSTPSIRRWMSSSCARTKKTSTPASSTGRPTTSCSA